MTFDGRSGNNFRFPLVSNLSGTFGCRYDYNFPIGMIDAELEYYFLIGKIGLVSPKSFLYGKFRCRR